MGSEEPFQRLISFGVRKLHRGLLYQDEETNRILPERPLPDPSQENVASINSTDLPPKISAVAIPLNALEERPVWIFFGVSEGLSVRIAKIFAVRCGSREPGVGIFSGSRFNHLHDLQLGLLLQEYAYSELSLPLRN